jgi:hypothetical protein
MAPSSNGRHHDAIFLKTQGTVGPIHRRKSNLGCLNIDSRSAIGFTIMSANDVFKMIQAGRYPQIRLKCRSEGSKMFLSSDDIVSLHSQVSELQRAITHQERVLAELRRLGEPTALAEKFLARLQARLAERQQHLHSLTGAAANENT